MELAPESAAEAEQAVLAAQVDDAITAAFSSLVEEQTVLLDEQCAKAPALTVLAHVSTPVNSGPVQWPACLRLHACATDAPIVQTHSQGVLTLPACHRVLTGCLRRLPHRVMRLLPQPVG